MRGVSMNLEYLKEFVELAKRLNYTETARALMMSQPTLSKHIGQLERSLKLTLVYRDGNSLRLTNAGGALLPFAYQILDAVDDFETKVNDLRIAPEPKLTISGLTDEKPSTEVLGFLISLLSGKYGSGCIEVKSQYNHNLIDTLEAEEVDVVYDPIPYDEAPQDDSLVSLHVADLQLTAIVSKDHRLVGCDSVSFSDLRDETFVKYEGLYLGRSWGYIEQICGRHGFAPKIRSAHCASVAELFSLCASLGKSVLVVGSNFGDRLPGGIKSFCKVLPITDADAAIPFYFIYRKDNENPVLADAVSLIERLPSPPLCFGCEQVAPV